MTEIAVTHGCIERGVRCSTGTCPVANALQLALGGEWRVEVDQTGIAIAYQTEGGPYILLPYEEAKRILKYDATGEMEPHCFTIDLPVAA